MSNPFNWAFMNEPLYRWFIFVIVILLFLGVWADVIRVFRSATSV